MPLDFFGYFFLNGIENTTIVSREHLMNLVNESPSTIYPRLSEEFKVDPIVLQIVFLDNNKHFNLLKYIPKKLQKDESFLIKLIERNELALGIVDETLLNDHEFIKKAILANSDAAFYLYDQFQVIYKKDKNYFDEIEIFYNQARLKQDYLEASKYIHLLNFLNLHSNGEVAPKELKKISLDNENHKKLNYKPDFIYDRNDFFAKTNYDNEFIEPQYIKMDKFIYCPYLYQNDKEVALKLLDDIDFTISVKKPTEYVLSRLSDALKSDRDIALQELKKNGLMLEYFSEEIKNNPDLVTIAIENNIDAYFLASSELRQYKKGGVNKELLLKVINSNSSFILHVNKDWLKDEDIISVIKKNSPILFELLNK
jgi:hypothetical protein